MQSRFSGCIQDETFFGHPQRERAEKETLLV
jgi:hypothetical protein